MWIASLLFTFELLRSLLGERSENVVRSHKRSQFTDETELVHFKDGSPDADPEAQGSTRIPPSALAWEQGVTPQPGQPYSGRTIWIRKLKTPLREFLRTETGGALVLLSAAIAALVWVNVDASSYDALWGTTLSIDVGGAGVALDLRHWVNSGLMTFFFFVLGLEARREFDLGELRERRRFALPLLAAIGGMATAVAIYLAFNMGCFVRARLGHRDVDRHGLRPRPPCARGATSS